MASVNLENIHKSFGDQPVLHGIDLDIGDGEFVVFVGPSGCGKSTLLRLIAGLETSNQGSISIGNKIVDHTAPSKRGVAMVFQSYALYPHMSVYNNMAFGLKQAKTPKKEIRKRVEEAANILGLNDLLNRSPKELSGGQRQRVAIGRAIVREPAVFLFDEPLSNLDAALRTQTRLEISRLHQRLKSTMIYVTHDQIEAMTLADRIVVLRDGRVEQYGTPLELYQSPANTFVAGFIGSPKMNFFNPDDIEYNSTVISGNNKDTFIGVRSEHLKSCDHSQALVTGSIELTEQLGEYSLVYLKTAGGQSFTVKVNQADSLTSGTRISFNAKLEHIHHFDPQSGLRL